jgi:deazaflavin-dependent oxidoreductase (nitroreductase family)
MIDVASALPLGHLIGDAPGRRPLLSSGGSDRGRTGRGPHESEAMRPDRRGVTQRRRRSGTMAVVPLPHVDPLAPRGPLYRAYVRLLGTRLAAWLSAHVVWKVDPHLLRLTRGRLGMGLMLPTALLETRGARSGLARRNGVIYFHDGETAIVVASKLGAAEHPAWFHNVRAHPDVRLGGASFRAEAVEDEAERARLWHLADRVFPPYAAYRKRAGRTGRTIPLVRLLPR